MTVDLLQNIGCVRRILAVVVVLMAGLPAAGGYLQVDPDAMLQGYQEYIGDSMMGAPYSFHAYVDYAVYDKSKFGSTPGSPFEGLDPSGGDDYVYAYQIVNSGDLLRTGDISLFTVGTHLYDAQSIASLADPYTNNPPHPAGTGEPPNPGASLGSSVAWSYPLSNTLAVGEKSTILLFTSPSVPGLDTATLEGGILALDTNNLPSPVPEPGTLVLLVVGGAAFLWKRGRESFFSGGSAHHVLG